ncbi:hypothetical protein D3C72_2093240 [compost metagenome]
MRAVGELHGQGVLARRQGDVRFRLSFAEMQMLFVHGYHLALLHRPSIDEQMMVARLGRHVAGRLDVHAFDGKLDLERARHCRAIGWLDEGNGLRKRAGGQQAAGDHDGGFTQEYGGQLHDVSSC